MDEEAFDSYSYLGIFDWKQRETMKTPSIHTRNPNSDYNSTIVLQFLRSILYLFLEFSEFAGK